jgi:tetratricopeptide (TPR) repeat protein
MLWLLLVIFQIWMLVHAIRQREWLWAVLIFIFPLINAVLYFFLVYRNTASSGPTRGFELPGAQNRKRIKELQAQIHHLDKAHHHSQLGDVYFQQGKLDLAEASYRAALERDPQDLDTRAHLGPVARNSLLRARTTTTIPSRIRCGSPRTSSIRSATRSNGW